LIHILNKKEKEMNEEKKKEEEKRMKEEKIPFP